VVSLSAVVVLVAGCTSSPSSSSTSTSGPASSTSSTSPTSTSTTLALAHCEPSGLTGSVVGTEGAAGTIEVTVSLHNVTTAPCALEGYPGAQLLAPSGAELPTDVVRGGSYSFTDLAAAPLTVAGGASAIFNFGYSDVPQGTSPCETAASMWVTPPDDVEHLTITMPMDQQLTVCDGGRLTVSPVFGAGSPETQTTAP
jgi:hypothetical protein